jgi:hypothetical protein
MRACVPIELSPIVVDYDRPTITCDVLFPLNAALHEHVVFAKARLTVAADRSIHSAIGAEISALA